MLDNLLAVLTITTSLLLVLLIVGAAWWLMWKVTVVNLTLQVKSCYIFQVFLSRFQFVNEILFPPTPEEEKQKTVSRRKIRKD